MVTDGYACLLLVKLKKFVSLFSGGQGGLLSSKSTMWPCRLAWFKLVSLYGTLSRLCCLTLTAQSEQRIEVTIKDYTFVTKQIPLRLGVPTVISIRNVDPERHDFGLSMVDGIATKVDSAGVISYARKLTYPRAGPQEQIFL